MIRVLELPHVLGVDAEVSLQRNVHLDALGDVDERAARPHRRVESRELVVGRRNRRCPVLLDQVLVLTQAVIHGEKDHALLLELFLHGVVDDLRVILRRNTGEELALGLGDAEAVEGVLDGLRHVVPGLALLFNRLEVVVDVVEIDRVEQVDVAPLGHRL